MQFDEKFFNEVGLGESTDEERVAFAEKLADLVLGKISLRLSEALSEEQLAKFDKLIEEESDEAAFAYVKEVYPRVDEMIAAEMAEVKKQFAQDMAELKQKAIEGSE